MVSVVGGLVGVDERIRGKEDGRKVEGRINEGG